MSESAASAEFARAAVCTRSGDEIAIVDLEIADPRADEILVRVVAAGVCHTDLTSRAFWPDALMPMVFGHEGAGVVEAVGGDVTDVAVGAHVVMSFRSCGDCAACVSGHPGYCDQFVLMNASGGRPDGTTALSINGSPVHGSFFGQSCFATHAMAHRDNVVVIDDSIDLVTAAPFGCSVQTGAGTVLNVLRPASGSTLAVFGAGSVGLAAVMAAVALDVTVIAVDPIAERRNLSRELGAEAAFDPSQCDVVEQIHTVAPAGVDVAIDTTAVGTVIDQAVASLGVGGRLALVGVGAPELSVSMPALMSKGRSVVGVIEGDSVPSQFLPELLAMHRDGRLPVERLITTYSFDDIEDALAQSADGTVVKAVIDFSAVSSKPGRA
jgi:aryl-alcohol dehydrogenase